MKEIKVAKVTTREQAKTAITPEMRQTCKVICVTDGVRKFIFRVINNRLHHAVK